MSFLSKISDTNNPDDDARTIKSANEIKIGGMYTIEGSVYFCIYIGTESYRYPGRVEETDYEMREREANEVVPRFDFIRLGTSTEKARFLSINQQKLNNYKIKKYSLQEEFTFGGGKKKSKKSKKSKGSKKSRGSKKSKGSKKSRGKGSK